MAIPPFGATPYQYTGVVSNSQRIQQEFTALIRQAKASFANIQWQHPGVPMQGDLCLEDFCATADRFSDPSQFQWTDPQNSDADLTPELNQQMLVICAAASALAGNQILQTHLDHGTCASQEAQEIRVKLTAILTHVASTGVQGIYGDQDRTFLPLQDLATVSQELLKKAQSPVPTNTAPMYQSEYEWFARVIQEAETNYSKIVWQLPGILPMQADPCYVAFLAQALLLENLNLWPKTNGDLGRHPDRDTITHKYNAICVMAKLLMANHALATHVGAGTAQSSAAQKIAEDLEECAATAHHSIFNGNYGELRQTVLDLLGHIETFLATVQNP